MLEGKASVRLVVRMIVGRGWGQGPQHSQSLQAMFAQAPGIRVIMPTTAYDAKGMLISAIGGKKTGPLFLHTPLPPQPKKQFPKMALHV